MSNKELITAYVGEWAKQIGRNPINPANGVIMEKSDDGHVCFIWKEQGMCWWWKVGADKLHNGSMHFDLLVRILRLEKPIAKPIEWDGLASCYASDEGYRIDCLNGKYHPVYCGRDLAPGCATLEEAQAICRAHKQAAYDKMGGWA